MSKIGLCGAVCWVLFFLALVPVSAQDEIDLTTENKRIEELLKRTAKKPVESVSSTDIQIFRLLMLMDAHDVESEKVLADTDCLEGTNAFFDRYGIRDKDIDSIRPGSTGDPKRHLSPALANLEEFIGLPPMNGKWDGPGKQCGDGKGMNVARVSLPNGTAWVFPTVALSQPPPPMPRGPLLRLLLGPPLKVDPKADRRDPRSVTRIVSLKSNEHRNLYYDEPAFGESISGKSQHPRVDRAIGWFEEGDRQRMSFQRG